MYIYIYLFVFMCMISRTHGAHEDRKDACCCRLGPGEPWARYIRSVPAGAQGVFGCVRALPISTLPFKTSPSSK